MKVDLNELYTSCFDTDFIMVEDGTEIVPGIRVLHSPGHSPGGLSVVIETAGGSVVITGFCCNRENFPAHGPAVCPGVHLDAVAAWESIQRVKALDMTILPLHDLGLKRIGGQGIAMRSVN